MDRVKVKVQQWVAYHSQPFNWQPTGRAQWVSNSKTQSEYILQVQRVKVKVYSERDFLRTEMWEKFQLSLYLDYVGKIWLMESIELLFIEEIFKFQISFLEFLSARRRTSYRKPSVLLWCNADNLIRLSRQVWNDGIIRETRRAAICK